MKRSSLLKNFILALALALLAACDKPATESTPDEGARREMGFSMWSSPRPLPAIEFQDEAGRALGWKDFRGKVVVLNVWATWCGPCREEMPTLDALQARLGGAGLEVVALSIDQSGAKVVREFFREIGVKHLKLYVDSSGQAMFTLNVLGIPTTLLLDREGREIGRLVGIAKWDSPEMVAFLKDVINRTQGDKQ